MRLPMKITREWLESHEACETQVELFEKVWPEGVVVTQKTLAYTAKAGLNLTWFAQHVLSETVYASYEAEVVPVSDDFLAKSAPLYAEYQAMLNPVVTDYQAEMDVVYNDSDAKSTPLLNYVAKCKTLSADYLEKQAPLSAEYRAKQDALLVTALWSAYEREANHGR